jgi:hypothetical protein
MRIYYMKKQLRFIFLLLFLGGFIASRLTAQTAFGSEAELKAQAAKLFDDDQFEEAYPLYAQLTSLYNKDPNYNFRLGVCMLYASEDKEKPIPFLELASKYPDVDKEVFFYLAKAYHLNYRFDDAIKQYQAYQKIASGPKAEKLQVARQIEMCKNGKKLLRSISDLIVIDKKEMSRTDFFRSYDISAIGGKLLAKPDEDAFKTPIDKKKKETSIIYFSSDNNQIYFSSYGDDPSHGKDIYLIRKLPNGELSKPQTLGYPVNTEYDEDFPFLHPNGKVLYFCSKGHNSMGGYDIFKTTLNELTNTWNKPVNLDFPINSPDDDILYVTNADEKEAYFSSARASATGKTAVYHINVERKPIDVAIINGTIVKNSADQDMNVKITVKDLDDNTVLGIFNSKPETGDFVMNLPSGGKVMYTVEAPGFPTQSEVITLPSQTTLTPLKQEISFETGTGKLLVKNSFDQPASDDNYLSVISLIKEKSKMDVNVNDVALDNPAKTNGTTDDATADMKTPGKPEKKPVNLSNDEIVKIAYTDAKDVEKEAKELKEQADLALVISNQKNEEAQNKAREAATLSASVAQETDNTKKQAALERVKTLDKEVSDANQVTVATYNVAKALELKADAKQKEADLSMQYAKDLEAAVKSKSSKEALAKLDEQQRKLDAISQKNDASANISNSLKLDADNKKRELDKAVQTSADIKQEIIDNEAVIASTEADAAKEKNESAKQGLQDQIAGLKEDIIASKKELESNETKVVQLQKDYDGINNQIELFNSVVDKAKTGGNETVAADAAAIDKTKLEQQVNDLKNADKTLASIKPITTESTGNVKATETAATPDIVTNTNNDTKKTVTEPATDTKTTEASTVTEPIKTVDKTTENPAVKPVNEPGKNTNTTETPIVLNKTETSILETPVTDAGTAADKTFEDALAATDVIPDKTEKETKKAEVYQNWSVAINSELTAKKQQLETETNPEKKNELTAAVSMLETKLKITEQSKTEALAQVEKLKQEQAVALATGKDSTAIAPDNKALTNPPTKTEEPVVVTNQADTQEPVVADTKTADNKTTDNKSTETPSEVATASTTDATQQLTMLEQVYNQEIDDAEKETSEQEKENKKLKAARNYVNGATLVVNSKKSDLKTESDQTKQQSLNQDIALLEQHIAEKQKAADESGTRINALDGTPVTTANTTPANTSKESTPVPVKNIVEPAKPFTYSNATAKTNLDKAAAADKEGDDLLAESKQVREQAALQSDVTEKNNMYARADELAASGESKKLEAAQAVGVANATEFRNNQHAVDQYANAVKNQTDEVSIAELLKDEAKTYFEKAQNSRKAAATFETYYAKQSALEDANKNELIALQKQNSALAIYKKNNPKLAIRQMTATELATTTPVVKKETSTTPSVVDETNTALNNTKPESENKETSVAATDQPTTNATIPPTSDTTKVNATETPVIKEQPVTDNETAKEIPVTDNREVKTPPVTDNATVKEPPVVDNTVIKEPSVTDNTSNPGTERHSDTPVLPTKSEIKNDGKKTTTETPSDHILVTAKTIKGKAKSKASRFKELFERRSKSAYSAANPIPLDEKLPDGLVFKVQMGAFKNAIPQNLFKGISPVSGETTAKGFIRYTAGLFFTCESADNAKKEIRTLGFPDAFVVAFMDGKRIPPPCGGDGTITLATPEEKTDVTAQPSLTTEPKVITMPVVTNPPVAKDNVTSTVVPVVPKEIAESKDVTSLSGLFYTIQVGVYSNPVSAAELNNVQPLYTENANGKVRYNVGVYDNIPQASEAKKIAINGGLKDAFMTIYYNGKRISMAEAATLTAQGVTPLTSAPDLNLLPSFNNGGGAQIRQQPAKPAEIPAVKKQASQPSATQQPETKTDKTVTPNATPTKFVVSQGPEVEPGVIFKVQIGAFNQEVPLDIANKFLKIAKKGIKNYKDENGLTIYTVGKYATYEEADKSRQEVAAEGLPDAFIVAYSDGKKIPVDEAQKLTGNK